MYYPYLYGKQKEALAVRELANLLATEQQVSPVFEPVGPNDRSLPITLEHCEGAGLSVGVVINPHELGFSKESRENCIAWGEGLLRSLNSRKYTYPIIQISGSTNIPEIKKLSKIFAIEDYGLALKDPSLDIDDVVSALGKRLPKIAFFRGAEPGKSIISAFGKNRSVWVEARFPHKPRNMDYSGRSMFTDRHLTYSHDGWLGFSDYTVLPPFVRKGGGPAGAVAFHLTGRQKGKPSKEIWVNHFVSKRNDVADTDVNGKFMEALDEFYLSAKANPEYYGLTVAASSYMTCKVAGDPPDLGTNKKMEVLHHLELMSGVMSGRF